MSGTLIAFEIVLLLPLFVGTWRTSLYGLVAQGLLIEWIALGHAERLSWDALVDVVDLLLLRAVAAPALLYAVLFAQGAPRRNEVIAPNLLSWVVALTLVLMAFGLADVVVPSEGGEQALVAVACSAVLLGFLVLATGRGPLSQMIGVLRVENGIALLELRGGLEHEAIGIRAAKTAIFLCSIIFFRWYLVQLSTDAPALPEEPAL